MVFFAFFVEIIPIFLKGERIIFNHFLIPSAQHVHVLLTHYGTFISCFKKATGQTPLQYRQRHYQIFTKPVYDLPDNL